MRWGRRAWRQPAGASAGKTALSSRRGETGLLNMKETEAAALEAEDDEAEHSAAALLRRSADLIARGACSVLVESAFAGLGTLLWPGEGTGVLQLLGNVLCYRF